MQYSRKGAPFMPLGVVNKKKTGIYIDEDVWNRFKVKVKSRGLSTCFVLESLMEAYLDESVKTEEFQHVVIKQNINYVVKKRRRSYAEFVPESNFFNGSTYYWEYREGPLNVNGHGVGCCCSICRPRH